MTSSRSIVLIDDDHDIGEVIAVAADLLGISCTATTDATAFLDAITPQTSLIFIDLLMPKLDGIELLRVLSQRQYTPPIVLMSGIGKRIVETALSLAESLGLTIAGHLNKPFQLTELEELLNRQVHIDPAQNRRREAPPSFSEEELFNALERKEFVVHYQPQIDIATGEVFGVEALVRWQHPTRGLIFPASFIPLLESRNLISRLDWIVISRSLSEIRQVSAAIDKPLSLAINLSVQSLRDLSLPDRFIALAEVHGVAPERVILEITEGGIIKELSSSLDVLARLRMKKVQLSVDDFGTGYSMLTQLRTIPANEIKIDQSFVQKTHTSDSDRVMVQKTIEIGHELGMKVTAEGVENEAQLEFLRINRCNYAQGYFFSRPLPLSDLARWLAAHNSPASNHL